MSTIREEGSYKQQQQRDLRSFKIIFRISCGDFTQTDRQTETTERVTVRKLVEVIIVPHVLACLMNLREMSKPTRQGVIFMTF